MAPLAIHGEAVDDWQAGVLLGGQPSSIAPGASGSASASAGPKGGPLAPKTRENVNPPETLRRASGTQSEPLFVGATSRVGTNHSASPAAPGATAGLSSLVGYVLARTDRSSRQNSSPYDTSPLAHVPTISWWVQASTLPNSPSLRNMTAVKRTR
jgi:hypothetical protein